MKWVVFSVICAIIASIFFIKRSTNNVCKTFEDYYSNRDLNKNCYHNPDYKLSVPRIIERHGYPAETHEVTTRDGYILSIFRIPHGRLSNKTNKKPIFLQHGIALNSVCFLSIGSKSLGFILADAGYDVWLGNFRGSKYSQNHTHLSYSDVKYWNFSFHEVGIYDLPAQISYVNKITQKKIIYLGYSMGTTSMYVYGTIFADIAFEQIDFFINFAPAVFMDKVDSFLVHFNKFWNYIEPILKIVHNGRLFTKLFPESLTEYLCLPYPFQMKLCQLPDMLNLGFDYEQNDPETLPITIINLSDYTSPKNVKHYKQLFETGEFRNYDYGYKDNLKIYGSRRPPVYDLSKMKIPVYLILAKNDLLISKRNVERLYDALPNNNRSAGIYYIKNNNFNHMDFVVAKDVVPLLYDHLLHFLNNR